MPVVLEGVIFYTITQIFKEAGSSNLFQTIGVLQRVLADECLIEKSGGIIVQSWSDNTVPRCFIKKKMTTTFLATCGNGNNSKLYFQIKNNFQGKNNFTSKRKIKK